MSGYRHRVSRVFQGTAPDPPALRARLEGVVRTGGDPRHGTADDPRIVLIGIDVHAAVFLEVDKPKPVVLYKLAKGWLTGERVEPGEIHERVSRIDSTASMSASARKQHTSRGAHAAGRSVLDHGRDPRPCRPPRHRHSRLARAGPSRCPRRSRRMLRTLWRPLGRRPLDTVHARVRPQRPMRRALSAR